ncbi:low temperature requirement protein A [Microbacterium sp. No. 7]|uniref:low temperature requirement protein A n=1 Tax=Microbacterium sp. No. 7 TaxID=1714373 RepID=UPI0006D21C13|nr:low temperature requirement protein A [Microbacterium sp. No. 7]
MKAEAGHAAARARAHYPHGLRRMAGRNTGEGHRPASPLELFFDLTFVVAFIVIGAEYAHGIATGHAGPATVAFLIAMLAVLWAWTGYSWFASAFDNDDWLFRVLTLTQMAGVVVLAIGVPALFSSLIDGGPVSAKLMVTGYVIMRVAVVAQWLRVAFTDVRYRRLAFGYAVTVGVIQLGWVAWSLLPIPLVPGLLLLVLVWAIELACPIVIERWSAGRGIGGSPWHPHHIAERYGLLAIIAIGETVIGTVEAARRISDAEGWTLGAVLAIGIGILTSFALWWAYFLIPSAPVLAARRDKVVPWAYGHLLLFASIVATGAGLHVVGYGAVGPYPVATVTVVAAIAIPVAVFLVTTFLLHGWLVSSLSRNPAHVVAFAAPVVAVLVAALGGPLWACLLIVLTSPLSVIVAYELWEWRSLSAALERALSRAGDGTGRGGRGEGDPDTTHPGLQRNGGYQP